MSTPTAPVMTAQHWFMLFVLSLLWGGSFVLIALGLRDFPPLTLVALRVSMAAVCLWAWFALRGQLSVLLQAPWRKLFVMGAMNNALPFSLIFWGQTHLMAGVASILNATSPLFAVLIAAWITRHEALSLHRISGVGVGMLGVAVTVGVSALYGMHGVLLAEIAILLASVSYAASGTYANRTLRGLKPLAIGAGQLTMASLIMLPVALLIDGMPDFATVSQSTWLALGLLVVPCTAMAYSLYFRLLTEAGAANALLVTQLVPISAIISGAWILGEQLQLRHMIGGGLVLLGLAVLDGRLFGYIRKRKLPPTATP